MSTNPPQHPSPDVQQQVQRPPFLPGVVRFWLPRLSIVALGIAIGLVARFIAPPSSDPPTEPRIILDPQSNVEQTDPN